MKSKVRFIHDEKGLLFRLAQLLEEGWTLPNSLELLLPHYSHHHIEAFEVVENLLKKGEPLAVIFATLGYDQRHLLPLVNAKSREQMIRALKQVAQQIERKQAYRQLLRKSFTYPFILFSFLVLFFVLFELLFIPHLETLFATRVEARTGLAYWLPLIAVYWPKVFLVGVMLFLLFVVFTYHRFRQLPIDEKVHVILRWPYLSLYARMNWTYRFSYSLSQLTAIGWTVQESVQRLMKQSYDPWIAYLAEKIYKELQEGLPLNKVLIRQPYWLDSFGPTTAHGFDRSMLTEELALYASLLEEEASDYFFQKLKMIQPVMLSIVAGTIVLFYVSMMLPIYQMFHYL